jgi:hypothetical protein
MKRARTVGLWAVLLLLAGMTLPAKQAAAAEDMDVLQKMKSAKTAADHQEIASYYDAQAADAKKKADLHRKMADTYQSGGSSIGKGSGPVPLPQHCQALAKMFDEEAAHYSAMAETERQLAKAVK